MSSKKPDKDYWTSTEASVWKDFLKTGTGQRLLRYLAESEPFLLRHGDINAILIRSGEVAQHKQIVSELLELTGAVDALEPETNLSPNYPPLDADEHWEGAKLNNPEA